MYCTFVAVVDVNDGVCCVVQFVFYEERSLVVWGELEVVDFVDEGGPGEENPYFVACFELAIFRSSVVDVFHGFLALFVVVRCKLDGFVESCLDDGRPVGCEVPGGVVS